MQNLLQDLRYGARMLLKQRGVTLLAVLTLALGIGANTAIFSVVNAVLLRPLPYAEPERLVAVYERDLRRPEGRRTLSYPNFFDLRAQSQSFEQLASYYTNNATLTGVTTPRNVQSAVVTPSLFPLLGVPPHLGRWFVPEEEKPGARAVVLSHSFWQQQFNGDLNILGRSLIFNGKPFNVVGVMPAGFQFPIEAEPVEVWAASSIDTEKTMPDEEANTEQRGMHFLNAIGRLKPGVTVTQAHTELSAIATRIRAQYPETNKNSDAQAFPYHDDLVTDYRAALWIILGAVGCVLLIACANVANLLLARATARYREIAVRSALGANRWRIVRQLLTESLLLALSGGLLGWLLAWWGTEALVSLIPADVPRLSEIALDRWVFGFTLLVALLTGLLFGLAPALQASKIELTEAMKEGARGSSGGRARLRNVLVVVEIALALVLTVGAGLLLQTFRNLQRVDLGFDTSNVLTAAVELPDARYPKQEQAAAFYQNLLTRLRALPGVESVSAIVPLPLSGESFGISFAIAGRNFPQGENPSAPFRAITPDYFSTMKIPVLAGRAFSATDNAEAANVVIVNETFAQKFFPNENPLGKRLKPGISLSGSGEQWREIVGVVKAVKHRRSLSRAYEPEYYLPHAQMALGSLSLVLRTTSEPRALARAVEAQVHELDREIPLHRVKTLEQYLGTAVAQPKFNALLLSLFAGLALLLTAIGLYGVMAYSVLQRTQEIGIRVALGAQTSDVLRLILRHGLWLTLSGLGLGVAAAFGLTRLLQSMLYGVKAADPLIFAGVALLLAAVALLACLIPARRAAKVDPLIALRYE